MHRQAGFNAMAAHPIPMNPHTLVMAKT